MHKKQLINNVYAPVRKLILSAVATFGCLSISQQVNAQAVTPFNPVDQASYITRSSVNNGPTALYRVNLITQSSYLVAPLISNGTEAKINAIGYNITDNFIYGSYRGTGSSTSTTGTNDIVKIDANGFISIIDVPGLPVGYYDAGDVDANGNLYLYVHNASRLYKINLTTLAVTTITLNAVTNLTDFSVNDDGTEIWGVSTDDGKFVTYNVTDTVAARSIFTSGLPGGINTLSFYDNRKNLFTYSEYYGKVYLTDLNSGASSEIIKTPINPPYYQTDGAQPRNKSVYYDNQPQFQCEAGIGYVYDATNDDMYMADVTVTIDTLVASNITAAAGGVYNNMGYNPNDGYLWIHRSNTNQIARIGSDFSMQYFPVKGLPAVSFSGGDIDTNNIFYLVDGLSLNATKKFYKVDLNSGSPNYLSVFDSFTTSTTLDIVTDFALNPKDGNLYGIANTGDLIRVNPHTGVSADLGNTGLANPGSVILAFTDAFGTLYFQPSGTNRLYEIINTHLGNATATVFKQNIITITSGDAARCYLATFDPTNPLPIELTSFNGRAKDCKAVINWSIANHKDTRGFEIEYSNDGNKFAKVGELPATSNNFTFTYAQNAGTGYYRLKMEDNEGNTEFSHTISVKTNCIAGNDVTMYPNPVKDVLKIQGLTENSIVRIYNISGQLINEIQQVAATSEREININSYAAGTYIIKIINENGYTSNYRITKE